MTGTVQLPLKLRPPVWDCPWVSVPDPARAWACRQGGGAVGGAIDLVTPEKAKARPWRTAAGLCLARQERQSTAPSHELMCNVQPA